MRDQLRADFPQCSSVSSVVNRSARRFLLSFVVVAPLLLSGCGQVFIAGFSNPQTNNPSTVSGLVIIIHLGSTTDVNGIIVFTSVTFSSGGLSNTVNFCGDQQSQFALNQGVRAQFTPGTTCSTLVSVAAL